MKLSMKWLADYTDVSDVDIKAYCDRMTDTGSKVEGFEILAEDLARRDMDDAPIDESNYAELVSRIDTYIAEFEKHGTDNILIDMDT